MDEINVELEKEYEIPSKKTRVIIFVIIATIILSIICIGSINSKDNDNKGDSDVGASEYYVKSCTEEFILRFYSLKYPDTFDLKTIEYSYTSYADLGYELWGAEGYFTAENAIGMEIKKNYKVYMQFKFSDNKCHALWVVVDGETCWGNSDRVSELIVK